MRSITLPLVGFAFVAVLGCGQKNSEPPKGSGASPVAAQPPVQNPTANKPAPKGSGASPVVAQQVSAERLPFEDAFRAGRIVWKPVKNVELTTKTADGSKTQSTAFRMKFKYDANGIRSIDSTGYKTYTWPGRQATFGPGAVIEITNTFNVLEGELKGGDRWVWDGTNWVLKKVIDD